MIHKQKQEPQNIAKKEINNITPEISPNAKGLTHEEVVEEIFMMIDVVGDNLFKVSKISSDDYSKEAKTDLLELYTVMEDAWAISDGLKERFMTEFS